MHRDSLPSFILFLAWAEKLLIRTLKISQESVWLFGSLWRNDGRTRVPKECFCDPVESSSLGYRKAWRSASSCANRPWQSVARHFSGLHRFRSSLFHSFTFSRLLLKANTKARLAFEAVKRGRELKLRTIRM